MNNILIRRLTDLRESKNISRLAFSKLINISRTTYYNYEAGITEPDLDNLVRIAHFHGVSTDYLLGNNKEFMIKDITSYVEAVAFLEQHDFISLFDNNSQEEIIEIAKLLFRMVKSYKKK